MATARSAWGIDLGNRGLKAVKLVRDGDRLRVDDFEVIEHEQILSVSGDNRESMLQSALSQFVGRRNMKGIPVAVGVSGQQSFARFIKLPPVEDKKIPEIVRFEAIQQIPFPLDDVEWAYQLFRQPDSPDVEVGIFAMKKDLVTRQIAYFTSLDLNVQLVQMLPLAVYNGMHYDERVGQTTMFMDSGAEATDLVIAEGESVWLRTLPIGGNNFTEALAKSFKLSFAKAEELKRNAATSKYAKQIFQAMRPVFADLVSEIQRSIGFYASVHRDARLAKLVALGSTFQLPGLQKYLQQNLQLPVEKLDTFRALPPTDSKLAASFQEQMISLAAAYGLAVQAMGEGKITSSLLPGAIQRQKMWQAKTPWFALAAACFVVGAGGVFARWYMDDMAYERNEPIRQQSQQVLATANDLAGRWINEVQDKGADDRAKVLAIRALQEYRGVWQALLTEVLASAKTLPINEALRQIPRAERQTIVLDSVVSRYVPDITSHLRLDDLTSVATEAGTGSVPVYGGAGGAGGGTVFRPDGGARDRWAAGGGIGPRPAEMPADPSLAGADPNAPPPPRGFILTIRGSTPYGKDARVASEFVQREFKDRLVARTVEDQLRDKRRYHIVRAEIVNIGPRPRINVPGGGGGFVMSPASADGLDPDSLTSEPDYTQPPPTGGGGTTGFDPRGGAWGGGGAASGTGWGSGGGWNRPTPAGQFDPRGRTTTPMPTPVPSATPSTNPADPPLDPTKDRFFPNESIENDTVFTVVALVVLDPAQAPKAEGEAGGDADAGGQGQQQ